MGKKELKKNSKTNLKRKKKKKRSVSCSSSSSDSSNGKSDSYSSSVSLSSIDEDTKRKLMKKIKKLKKKEKQRKREKKALKKLKKKDKLKNEELLNSPTVSQGPCTSLMNDVLAEKSKSLAPMTKEEWEKQLNTFRHVFDEETGRMRLVKGCGEIVEECVSRERHLAINKQATRGDGDYFQKTLKKYTYKIN